MIVLMFVLVFFTTSLSEPLNRINLQDINKPISMLPTRRILRGRFVGDTRPYMVYLRAARNVSQRLVDSHWLCGGVIINEQHILTSAACIEDVQRFYVISGTHKWIPPEVTNNQCLINGAKKAIWKCIPIGHNFDGKDFDNIRWMVGDIAIVRVEDKFNFKRKILGCDFIPQRIAFNNLTINYEKSGTLASIAGWGTTRSFTNIDNNPIERATNSVDLLETDVVVVSKRGCTAHWDKRYHDIINNQMICTKDALDDLESEACQGRGADCKPLHDSDSEYFDIIRPPIRRMISSRKNRIVHTASHYNPTRRFDGLSGGFCENDHGGPLVVGRGKSATVIGVMSACQTKAVTQKCYGPFLFTSIYKYRDLVSLCSTPELGSRCENLIRASHSKYQETSYDWSTHIDGTQKVDNSGKFVLRSYAQTPLYPIMSPSVTEEDLKTDVSATAQATTQKTLKSQTEEQRNNEFSNWTPGKSVSNTSSSVFITSTQPSILKFSLPQVLTNSVSKNSSSVTQIRKSFYNYYQKNAKSTSKDNSHVYTMVQDWQQNYLNYLNTM